MELDHAFRRTEAGVIPADWVTRPMLDAVKVANGQVDPKEEPYQSMILVAPDHIESGTGRLLATETAAAQKAISGKYLFEPGDIVYSKIRPYLRKAVLVDFVGLCSADMYPLKAKAGVSTGYIFATILGSHFSRYAESVSVRSGMPKINREELAAYTVALPPTLAEQQAIAKALSDADALIESLEQLLAKKRQIKQGAMQELLTGKKRLPGFGGPIGFKPSELGEIPADWESTQMGTVVDVLTGFPFPSKGYSQSGVRLLRGSNVKRGATDWYEEGTEYWPVVTNEIRQYLLKAGDVVVAMDGSLVGRSFARLSDGDVPALLLQRVARLRSGIVDQDFLGICVCSPRFTDHCDSVKTVTAIPHISPVDIRAFRIALPPTRDEQKAIAQVLVSMDLELTSLESKLAKARQIKNGMMQELLTGRIRLL